MADGFSVGSGLSPDEEPTNPCTAAPMLDLFFHLWLEPQGAREEENRHAIPGVRLAAHPSFFPAASLGIARWSFLLMDSTSLSLSFL